jgi:hypothetical protein
MTTAAEIQDADGKLRIRLAEIDRDLKECHRMLDHDPWRWANRREGLNREKVQVQLARAQLKSEVRRDDEPARSSTIFWGANG